MVSRLDFPRRIFDFRRQMTPQAPTVALTSTFAMVLAADAAGSVVDDLLAEVGVGRGDLVDPEVRLPLPEVLALWDRIRDRVGNPVLQLEAPSHLPVGAYKVIEYLIEASPTVGEAIGRFARFFCLIADYVSISVEAGKGEQRMGITMADGRPAPSIFVDYAFAALTSRIRVRTRPGMVVKRVEFRQPHPGDPSPYESLFLAPVFFGCSADRLCFSDEEWAAPTERGDESLAQLMEEHARILAERLPGPRTGIVSDVRQVILEALPENPGADEVAQSLHVSTRTLQRRLAGAAASFSEVSDGVRSELAKEYLSDLGVRISEVAFLLGFSEQSSFNRAFRRWTGLAPGRWRENPS
jgi:AraC-like DNA-binding protein